MKAIEEFESVESDSELYAFLKQYAFSEDTRQTSAQILGVYRGTLDGNTATITHRWHDPSGPFQNEPDIHKAKLEVAGRGTYEVAYEG
jgi:hypothetical protein